MQLLKRDCNTVTGLQGIRSKLQDGNLIAFRTDLLLIAAEEFIVTASAENIVLNQQFKVKLDIKGEKSNHGVSCQLDFILVNGLD